MRAIISAAKRDGLPELARDLQKHGIHIFSTSGTLDYLKTEGIHAESVSTLTQFPEILGGRVKTLHPAILGGILARRDLPEHVDELQTHAIVPIDVVVVNLYPFAETIAQPDTTLSEAQEQIDIGGVTLIRAAAKNFQDVIVLVRPQDYATVMQEWDELGEVSLETRRRLAAIAFQHTANYDTSIAEYLRKCYRSRRADTARDQDAAIREPSGRGSRPQINGVCRSYRHNCRCRQEHQCAQNQ